MPMYWADYYRDTQHLTTLQHGMYLLLMAHYWTHGSLPGDDDEQMAAITKMSVKAWQGNKPVMAHFFHKGWKHKRIEQELKKAGGKIEARRLVGAYGGVKSGEARRARAEQRKLAEIQEYIKTNKLGSNQTVQPIEANSSAEQSKTNSLLQTDEAKCTEANRFASNQSPKKERIERSTPPVENVDNVDNPTGIPVSEYKPVTGSLATALPSGALARRVETTRTADLLPENKFEPLPGRFLNQSGLPSHGDNFRMLTQEEADKLSEQLLQNPWLNGPIQ